MTTTILNNSGARRMLAAMAMDKSAGAEAIGYDEAMREDGAPVQRMFAKFAAQLFEETHPLHHLYAGLSKCANWCDAYDQFTEPVWRAVGLGKDAAAVALAAHDKVGGGIMKALVSAGVIGGAGLGTLGFMLNRDARQYSAESKALLEQIRAYKQIRRDIEEDMKHQQLS